MEWVIAGFAWFGTIVTGNRLVTPIDCASSLEQFVTGVGRTKTMTGTGKGILAMRHGTTRPSNCDAISDNHLGVVRSAIRHREEAHASIARMRELILALRDNPLVTGTHSRDVANILDIVVGHAESRIVLMMVIEEG